MREAFWDRSGRDACLLPRGGHLRPVGDLQAPYEHHGIHPETIFGAALDVIGYRHARNARAGTRYRGTPGRSPGPRTTERRPVSGEKHRVPVSPGLSFPGRRMIRA